MRDIKLILFKKNNLIHYILLFSLLIRLYHINFPVSGWHEWRQADTASIAKNFFENGFHIFYPEVNWGGLNHYVESEFQIYPFIVSIFYSLFGFNEIWGRLLSISFSLFTIYGLYLLTRKIIDEGTALWASFIYSFLPLSVYFGRVIMPEPMMMMCIVYSIYFFYQWIECNKHLYLILSFIFTVLAVLIKLPNLYIGLPLCYLAYQKYKWKFATNWKLLLFTLFVFLFSFLWYYHAHELYVNGGSSFNIWGFGSDKWGNIKLLYSLSFYKDILFRYIGERHLTYPGFIVFIIGLFIKRENKYEKLFDYWMISLVIYVLIVAQGNRSHDYYQLPCVLTMAVFIGKTFNKYLIGIKEHFKEHFLRYTVLILSLVLILGLSYLKLKEQMILETLNQPYFRIANELKMITSKDDLIITVNNGNPVYLYTADRKGWISAPEEFTDEYMQTRIKEGAKIITGLKEWLKSDKSISLLNDIINKYKVIENNKEYFIVELKEK